MSRFKTYRGRIAPTPSGFLHLGHARTFATACERARLFGGKIVLRIEDIDSQRTRQIYKDQIIPDLKKAGITWDEGDDIGGDFGPYTQSKRLNFYKEAFFKLLEKNLVYPSLESRAQIKALSKAPCEKQPSGKSDDFEKEAIFPLSLRPKTFEMPQNPLLCNWRFKVPQGRVVEFEDKFAGHRRFVGQIDFGDFLVWRKSGEPSYELAVVADDIAMQISEVVRGRDLLLSTARQILLYETFSAKIPDFAHCPLLLDASQKKLSKSVLKNEAYNPFLIKNIPEDSAELQKIKFFNLA